MAWSSSSVQINIQKFRCLSNCLQFLSLQNKSGDLSGSPSPFSHMPRHAKNAPVAFFSWCFCMPGFGPVQNQEIGRSVKGKIMGEALKEVLFLRKQGVFKSLPQAVEWTIPSNKKNLILPTVYGPIIPSSTPPPAARARMPVPWIGLNFLGAHCSDHWPTLVPLASTWTPLVSRHGASIPWGAPPAKCAQSTPQISPGSSPTAVRRISF